MPEFEELEGSPTIRIAEQGTTAQRMFRVDWDQWQAFARRLIGSYRVTACSFTFQPPIPFPGMPNLVVSDIAVEPFDPGNPRGEQVSGLAHGTNRYPHAGARVSAVYRTLFDTNNRPVANLPGIPRGTYVTFDADMETSFHPLPSSHWRWNAGGFPTVEPELSAGIVIPSGQYRLTWHRVAMPPWDTIRELRGAVNASSFLGAASGTVMFLGARATRQFQFLGEGGFWTVEYLFSERSVPLAGGGTGGWNHQFREVPIDGEHWIEVIDASGNPPHRSENFGALFQFPICA